MCAIQQYHHADDHRAAAYEERDLERVCWQSRRTGWQPVNGRGVARSCLYHRRSVALLSGARYGETSGRGTDAAVHVLGCCSSRGRCRAVYDDDVLRRAPTPTLLVARTTQKDVAVAAINLTAVAEASTSLIVLPTNDITRLDSGLLPNTVVTAFTVDASYGMAALAYNAPSSAASTILTLSTTSNARSIATSPITLIGTHQLPQGNIALACVIDTDDRTLLISALRVAVTVMFTYNFFGVLGVHPPLVDAGGGTPMHVVGAGFPSRNSNHTSVWCVLGNTSTRATIVNSSFLTCDAPASGSSAQSTARTYEHVNVVVRKNQGGSNFTTNTSNNAISVMRPVSAMLEGIRTSAGSVGYGHWTTEVTMTITGFGFVQTPFAACRLVNHSTRAVIFQTQATVVNSSSVVCVQPADTPPSVVPTCVEYSHDGFYFSISCVPYQVSGSLGGVRVFLQDSSMNDASHMRSNTTHVPHMFIRADATVALPAFQVETLDRYGNPRGVFEDTAGLVIACSTYPPNVAIANAGTEKLTFQGATQLMESVENGVATFASAAVIAPTAGAYTLHCYAPLDTSIVVVALLTVSVGVPVRAMLVVSPSWIVGVQRRTFLQP